MIAVSVSVSFLVAGEHLVKDAIVASGVKPYVTRPALEHGFGPDVGQEVIFT